MEWLAPIILRFSDFGPWGPVLFIAAYVVAALTLAPAFVLTAGYDPLRDEGLHYAQRLTEAGNRATHINFERQIHGFITMGKVIDEANAAVAICAGELQRALAARPA